MQNSTISQNMTGRSMLTLLFLAFLLPLTGQRIIWNGRLDRGPFLGVQSEEVSRRKAELLGFENRYGSYVTAVIPKTAAEEAGLQPMDYIYGVNDLETDWTADLTDLLQKHEVGEEVVIHYIRKGKKERVTIALGKRSTSGSTTVAPQNNPFLGVREHSESDDYEPGVKVNIVNGSTADEMGLRNGDVIMAINDYPIIDWTDISASINMLRPGETIRVDYEREGNSYTASGSIRSQADRANTAANFFGQASPQNEGAFLGIYSTSLSKSKAEKLGIDNPYGSYVSGVMVNTAAEEAGLQPLDYVYGVDEYRTGEDQSLTDILRKFEAGESATLHFIRKGKPMTQKVTFRARREARNREPGRCEDPFLGVRQAGNSDQGVRVDIVEKSTAEAIGMEDNDQIIAINGYRIIDWEDVSNAINGMNVGAEIEVTILRNGQEQTLRGPIQSNCDTPSGNNPLNFNWDSFADRFNFNFNRNRSDRDDNLRLRVEALRSERIEAINEEMDFNLGTENNLDVNRFSISRDDDASLFTLAFELPGKGQTVIRIFNEKGRVIYNYDLGSFTGDFRDEVDLAQNGAGAYYLYIRQGSNSTVKEITLF